MKRGKSKKSNSEISSLLLKALEKELVKVQKAEDYLEKERIKLMKEKERIRSRIKKEKEILKLKDKIKRVKARKK